MSRQVPSLIAEGCKKKLFDCVKNDMKEKGVVIGLRKQVEPINYSNFNRSRIILQL